MECSSTFTRSNAQHFRLLVGPFWPTVCYQWGIDKYNNIDGNYNNRGDDVYQLWNKEMSIIHMVYSIILMQTLNITDSYNDGKI